MSVQTNNLATLYAQYQIDPSLYPPPDLRLADLLWQHAQPSYCHLPTSTRPTDPEARRQANNNREPREWIRNPKNSRSSGKKTKKSNRQLRTDELHYRNTITVRRISCQDLLDASKITRECCGGQHAGSNKRRSTRRLKDNAQIKTAFPTWFNSSTAPTDVHPATRQSRKSVLSSPPSAMNEKLDNKMSNFMGFTASRAIGLRESSTTSLDSTKLHVAFDNPSKADIISTSSRLGSHTDLESFLNNAPHSAASTLSVVPHFSSTIAPLVPRQPSSSSAIVNPKALETRSNVVSSGTSRDMKDLVDQLRTCIATLSLLLENKAKHGKHIVSNGGTYLNGKRNRTTTEGSYPVVTSTSTSLRPSKRPSSNAQQLLSVDMTIRECAPLDDRHEELKRCLLVYYHDQAQHHGSRNVNSNDVRRYLGSARNRVMFDRPLLSARYTHSSSNSTVILADEEQSLDAFLCTTDSLK